jgi:hypothetical protein
MSEIPTHHKYWLRSSIFKNEEDLFEENKTVAALSSDKQVEKSAYFNNIETGNFIFENLFKSKIIRIFFFQLNQCLLKTWKN